jgi:hypothetical protein
MSTWHQDQARTKLYDEDQWTVMSNPPHQCRTLSLFPTEATAKAAKELWERNGQTHLSILPPANHNRR